MQKNILWEGIEYHSLENCIVTTIDAGVEISAVIVGAYEKNIYKVEYSITVNRNWEINAFELKSQLQGKMNNYKFKSDASGNWWCDNQLVDEFNGCLDVDIPLTPFTNTLPIKRLKLSTQESKEIKVIYFDVLAEKIMVVRQKYTRLGATTYQYQNIPNDFDATITVDEFGIVKDYPELFKQVLLIENPDPVIHL